MDGTIKLKQEEIPRSIQGHFMNFRSKLFLSHFAFIRNIFRLKWMERNKIARRMKNLYGMISAIVMTEIFEFTGREGKKSNVERKINSNVDPFLSFMAEALCLA